MLAHPDAPAGVGVVIVAAGAGTRFGEADKVFAPLGGKALLAYSLTLFASMPEVGELVLVMGRHTLDRGMALVSELGLERVQVCIGGGARSDSVRAGLGRLGEAVDVVAVHDGARPLVTRDLAQRVLAAARATGAALPAVDVCDTLHLIAPDGTSAGVVDRSRLRAAQTPQAARRDWLLQAFTSIGAATDEGALLQAAGFPVALVPGDPANLKITWPGDLVVAEALLRSLQAPA